MVLVLLVVVVVWCWWWCGAGGGVVTGERPCLQLPCAGVLQLMGVFLKKFDKYFAYDKTNAAQWRAFILGPRFFLALKIGAYPVIDTARPYYDQAWTQLKTELETAGTGQAHDMLGFRLRLFRVFSRHRAGRHRVWQARDRQAQGRH